MKAYEEVHEAFNTNKMKMIKNSFKYTGKKDHSRLTYVKMSGSNNEMMQSNSQKES